MVGGRGVYSCEGLLLSKELDVYVRVQGDDASHQHGGGDERSLERGLVVRRMGTSMPHQ